MTSPTRILPCLAVFAVTLAATAQAKEPWIVLPGGEGPGKGKHVVLISGDEEYRSEETLPQLAKILSKHHGFRCTVLFAIDPETGEIDPNRRDNIPGLAALRDADLMVLFLRFRDLPPDQMQYIQDYIAAGKPIVALRTSTHAFAVGADQPYAHWDWRSKAPAWEGGFGRRILGETWISHHGHHGHESTRGVIPSEKKEHPIVRGIEPGTIWGPSDVYGVRLPLPGDSDPLVLGQVLTGMQPSDPPVEGAKNDPMMPIAWTKTYTSAEGNTGRVFVTTMGASQDFTSEGLRRLLVNACYWAVGLEDRIPPVSKVDLVGEYEPTPFEFGGFRKGIEPSDLVESN